MADLRAPMAHVTCSYYYITPVVNRYIGAQTIYETVYGPMSLRPQPHSKFIQRSPDSQYMLACRVSI
jgi:hypothetical protein